jgi:hypothetical protein
MYVRFPATIIISMKVECKLWEMLKSESYRVLPESDFDETEASDPNHNDVDFSSTSLPECSR